MRALKKIIICCLLALSSGLVSGQVTDYGDSKPSDHYRDTVWLISGKRTLGPLFKKWKFDFVLDGRRTLVSSTETNLPGIRVGLEFRRVNRFGIGIYGLGSGVHTTSLTEVDSSINEAILNMSYASVFYERILLFNRRWELSATVHQGTGIIEGKYRSKPEDEWISYKTTRVRPFELSTIGYYNLTWWCNIGVGVGYRFMRNTPVEVRPIYNAPVAIARVRIRLGRLTQSIWDKEVKYRY